MVLARFLRVTAIAGTFRDLFDTLLANSLYGIGITGVNSAAGFVYWALAARSYSSHAVGLATALIAAMSLVSMLSNLGGGAGLVQRLPAARSVREWCVRINATLGLCAALGAVAALGTIYVLPLLSPRLAIVRDSPVCAATFAVGLVLWTLCTDMDFVFVAERKVKFGLARNTAFSIAKLPLVVLPALVGRATATGLLSSWVAGSAIALAVAIHIARHRLRFPWKPIVSGVWREMRETSSSLVGHHLINLGGSLPMYLLPLVVTTRLGVVQNAWAYVGWMVGSFALVVSPTVSASLFAEGSHDVETFTKQARRSLIIIIVLIVPAIVGVVVLGHEILAIFGRQYERHSYTIVVVLALSAIPDAITNVFVVSTRVHARLSTGARLNLAMAGLAVILAWVMTPSWGVSAIAWAWLIAQMVGSAYAVGVTVFARRARTDIR